jgi:VanZ family protein
MERTPRRSRGRLYDLVSAWAPPAVLATLIFVLSATPDLRFLPDPGIDFALRKVGHMAVFGVLALLLWRGFERTQDRRSWGWAWALVLTIAYAIFDEFHQSFVGGRVASPVDVAIDTIGALIAVSLAERVRNERRRRGSARSKR